MQLEFIPWRKFWPKRFKQVDRRYLTNIAYSAASAMRKGMRGAHKGSVAKRQDGTLFNRSTPDEFPAVDSGKLIASMRTHVRSDEAGIGTNVFYSKFLREGAKHLARRRMSDTALRRAREGNPFPRGWVAWNRRK